MMIIAKMIMIAKVMIIAAIFSVLDDYLPASQSSSKDCKEFM